MVQSTEILFRFEKKYSFVFSIFDNNTLIKNSPFASFKFSTGCSKERFIPEYELMYNLYDFTAILLVNPEATSVTDRLIRVTDYLKDKTV